MEATNAKANKEVKHVKWYICGPITGYDIEERRKAFEEVEQLVKKVDANSEVFNPLKNGLPEDASYSDHMMCDLEALVECDLVILMEGWRESRGCLNELKFAERLKMPIIGMCERVNDEVETYVSLYYFEQFKSWELASFWQRYVGLSAATLYKNNE